MPTCNWPLAPAGCQRGARLDGGRGRCYVGQALQPRGAGADGRGGALTEGWCRGGLGLPGPLGGWGRQLDARLAAAAALDAAVCHLCVLA